MKNYKKHFICALATLFVGASIGGVSSLAANAATTLTYTEKTQLETPPASQLPLEDDKIKNITEWGYYNVDGEDVWYFSGDGTASGNPEIRFVTPGTDTSVKNPETGLYYFQPKTVDGFSFTYKIVNEDEKPVADKDVNYIVQAIASDGSYPIFSPEIIADGEWHTLDFDLKSVCTWNKSQIDPNNTTFDESNELFSGFIFKMGGLKGEFMISDVYIRESKTQLEAAPATPIALEEGKVKNMTEWGYYNYGGKDSFYFYGNGTAAADPEVRFITEGTQTMTKPYTFAPVSVDSFSFDYKLTNTAEKGVADLPTSNYIVQVLASDGSYPIFVPTFVADGEWHTLTFDLNTPCTWAKAAADDTEVNFDDVNELFSGMIVKAGGLKGELAIANVTVEETVVDTKIPLENPPESPLALEETKNKGMTGYGFYNVDGKDVWYFTSDGTKPGGKNPEIRFITEGTDTDVKPYTFAPVAMDSFSFSYKLTNTAEEGVVDLPANNYIVQVLASDGSYPIFTPAIVADGEWHTLAFDLTTVLSDGRTFDDVNELFSGFIVKAGNLNGELMIADIEVVESAPVVPEVVVNATLSTHNLTWGQGTSWYYGRITGETGFVNASDAYYAPKAAANVKLVRDGVTYDVGTPNCNFMQADQHNQFFINPNNFTFDGNKKVQDGDMLIIEGDFVCQKEGSTNVVARFEKTVIKVQKGASASFPNGDKLFSIVETGEYTHITATNVVDMSGDVLGNGFYFDMDKNDAPLLGWGATGTEYYKAQPNAVYCIKDGVVTYIDREATLVKITGSADNERYYFTGASLFGGQLLDTLSDGDVLVLNGTFYNGGTKSAITFNDVRFAIYNGDRDIANNPDIDVKAVLVNPNVTFKNADGTVFANSGTLAIGSLVTPPESIPTMPEDEEFRYEFEGWALGGELYDFSKSPAGQITLTAKYKMIPKGAVVEAGYAMNAYHSGNGERNAYFVMTPNEAPYAADWSVRYSPITNDAIVVIRDGERIGAAANASNAICKYSETAWNLSGWLFTGGFKDGDIVVLNGYFRGYSNTLVQAEANGYILHIEETWFKYSVDADGKVSFDTMNPEVKYVDADGGLIYKTAYAYGKPFTPAIPEDEYFTYNITSCLYNGEDFDATQVYSGAITLTIEYEMVAKNAIETGYAVTDKWSNHSAGDGYFYMAANDAPYDRSWNVRYEPVTPDAFVLIRDGVATPKGDVTNSNNKQVLTKIDENKYNIAGWYIGNAKHGDILVFNGYFKGWTKVDGVYQENGTILHIPATYIQYTEVDGKKAWTVLNPGVVFMDNAGKILSITSGAYGETFKLNEKDIPVVTKEADNEYTYTFLSWFNGDNSFDITTEITSSIELRPAFNKTPVDYTVTVTMPNGTTEVVTFNVETANVKALVEAKKPADNQEYTYAWGGKGLPESFDLTHYDLEIVATPVEYTITVAMPNGTTETVNFSIETIKEAKAQVEALLPENNVEYTYAWGGKGLPEIFDLTHYDLEIVATPVEYTAVVNMNGTSTTITFTVESVKEAKAQVDALKPADTAAYTYTWEKNPPEIFDLTNYEFNLYAMVNNYKVLVHNADGSTSTFTFNVDNAEAKTAEIKAMLPASTAEYTYTWEKPVPELLDLCDWEFTVVQTANVYTLTIRVNPNDRWAVPETRELAYGEAIELTAPEAVAGKNFLGWVVVDAETNETSEAPATMPASHLVIYGNWEVSVYTVTVHTADGETTVFNFAVEADYFAAPMILTSNDVHYELSKLLPEDTEEYTYAWDKEIPAELELQNYEFTVIATEVELPVPPETSEDPATSEDPETSEDPATSEEPTTDDSEAGNDIVEDLKEQVLGCFSGVNAITYGVIALGLGVMKLLKKKED